MRILVVNSDPDRLWRLVDNVRLAFPDATVEYTHDPRASNLSEPVDLLFAELTMKRMGGLELIRHARDHNNPHLKAYLLVNRRGPLTHDGEAPAIDGVLLQPVTLETLQKLASAILGEEVLP